MYLKFSNFRGRTSAGGGGKQALVQKRGQVSDGEIDKIFAGWGDPPSPQKKTLLILYIYKIFLRKGRANSKTNKYLSI